MNEQEKEDIRVADKIGEALRAIHEAAEALPAMNRGPLTNLKWSALARIAKIIIDMEAAQ